ncbi:hypothetical protein ACE11G_13765 [Gordonia sp. PS3]|uniref:hypothetical protein n=1 Tax=unclassified Gordonia (in: high G+C Gram-positive bacteria) TaxID=2657482 RepID=UPI0007848308|nr:hypothetical protein [Gordonia sp. QH-12]KXT56465.1 hypothetical protein Y710_13360 [Gordonia sp. QH-12]
MLSDQLRRVDPELIALGRLRERLAAVVAAGDASVECVDPAEMLRLMRAARTGAGEVLDRHLNGEQRERLAAAAAETGPGLAYRTEIEWPHLYRRVEELRLSGATADDPRVQKLVSRMEELSVQVTGDDAEISAAVRGAWRDDPAGMSGGRTGSGPVACVGGVRRSRAARPPTRRRRRRRLMSSWPGAGSLLPLFVPLVMLLILAGLGVIAWAVPISVAVACAVFSSLVCWRKRFRGCGRENE